MYLHVQLMLQLMDKGAITFDYGNATLNNDIYLSGSIVSKPGYYQFLLSGANGYVEECNFTITCNMDGVSNNNVYDSDIEVIFNGEGYLNNQFVNSPLHVKRRTRLQCSTFVLAWRVVACRRGVWIA